MKKVLSLIIILFSSIFLLAQDYNEIDAYAKSVKFIENYTVRHLAHDLTDKFDKDEDKVRAIFYWITENIAYATDYSHNKNSEETLIRKKGVCNDYSVLFNDLCENSGIKSYKIIGYTKTIHSVIGLPTFSNHAWNVVEINNKKYLLDVTWASGSVFGSSFNRKRKERYYLCPPELFVLNHLPEKEEWQLLTKPVDEQSFINFPIFQEAYISNKVFDFEPMNGFVIDNVINFSFKTDQIIKSISACKYPWNTYGKADVKKINFEKKDNTYFVRYPIPKNRAYRIYFDLNGSSFVIFNVFSPNFRVKKPNTFDLKDKSNVVLHILDAFRNSNIDKINRMVLPENKITSFNDIEYSKELILLLSKWHGQYSGSLARLRNDNYGKVSNCLFYRINHEYMLKFEEQKDNWYFHSIIPGSDPVE